MRTLQLRVYVATMSRIFSRLTALVWRRQYHHLDERTGVDLRRDLHIVYVSSDIQRVLLDEALEALVGEVGFRIGNRQYKAMLSVV